MTGPSASQSSAAPAIRPFIPPDYHVHTIFCKHAEGSVGEYREAAARLGMAAMCFTDHLPTPVGYDPVNRMQMTQFPLYLDMLRQFQGTPGPRVLLGAEADYHPDCEAYLRAWLPRQPLDLVIGSVHYIRDWGFDDPAERNRWTTADVREVWREYFALLAALADTRLYDVVGHLDLPKKFGHRLGEQALRELAQPALDHVAAAGMAIEINTAGLRKPVGEMYPSPLLLALARSRDIPICFGSDAHRPQDVGAAFPQAVLLARQAGYAEHAVYARRVRTLQPIPQS